MNAGKISISFSHSLQPKACDPWPVFLLSTCPYFSPFYLIDTALKMLYYFILQKEILSMHTQKVAITVPKNLLIMIDRISEAKGLSRSKLISSMLKRQLMEEKAAYLKNAYDTVFKDDSIREEQRLAAKWFENTGNEGGQEW
jgi:hypothetical protein